MMASRTIALGLLAALLSATPETAQFDAASIKPATPNLPGGGIGVTPPSGGPGTADPGRMTYRVTSLKLLLLAAYDASAFQIVGPGWLDTELYEVTATMPPDTTKARFQAMLQNLLAARFQLKAHRETRALSGYALVLAKNGPKFKESRPAAPEAATADSRPQLGPDGYFVAPQRPGMYLQIAGPAVRSNFRQVTMPMLAATLQSQLQRPVTDATGLTRTYDFVLNYAREGIDLGRGRIPVSQGNPEPQPDLLAALPEQLGLRLEAKKTATEVIVIDQAEKSVKQN